MSRFAIVSRRDVRQCFRHIGLRNTSSFELQYKRPVSLHIFYSKNCQNEKWKQQPSPFVFFIDSLEIEADGLFGAKRALEQREIFDITEVHWVVLGARGLGFEQTHLLIECGYELRTEVCAILLLFRCRIDSRSEFEDLANVQLKLFVKVFHDELLHQLQDGFSALQVQLTINNSESMQ